MKTYPLLNDADQMTGFEISSLFFPSSASVSRFFEKCPGVQVTRRRKLFESGNEVHAELEFEGGTLIVWEPFGDNSRFWIGPKEESETTSDSLQRLHDFVSSNWPGPIQQNAWFRAPVASLSDRYRPFRDACRAIALVRGQRWRRAL